MPSISSDTAASLLAEYERHMATITMIAKALLTACHRLAEPGNLPDATIRIAMRATIEAAMDDVETMEEAVGIMTEATINVGNDMLEEI